MNEPKMRSARTVVAQRFRPATLLCITLLGACWLTDGSAASSDEYASAWTDSFTDWNPPAPSPNPLGPPDGNCTGASNAGEVWAEFSFSGFCISAGDTIVGIEVYVNYSSVISPTAQLRLGGSNVGSPRPVPATPVEATTCEQTLLRTAGGPADTWGAGLTANDLNSGEISVRITRDSGPDNPVPIDIESVRLLVFHSSPSLNCGPVDFANGFE